jgi:hypothetical protein
MTRQRRPSLAHASAMLSSIGPEVSEYTDPNATTIGGGPAARNESTSGGTSVRVSPNALHRANPQIVAFGGSPRTGPRTMGDQSPSWIAAIRSEAGNETS